MNKNFASRALKAIGLKSKITRIEIEPLEGNPFTEFSEPAKKSAAVLRATKEELLQFSQVALID